MKRVLCALCALASVPQIAHASLPPFDLADCDAPAFASTLRTAEHKFDATAYWLNDAVIQWPGAKAGEQYALVVNSGLSSLGDGVDLHKNANAVALVLRPHTQPLSSEVEKRFQWLDGGVRLSAPGLRPDALKEWLKQDVLLTARDANGNTVRVARLQHAGALDALYADAAKESSLGVAFTPSHVAQFKLWAPTAQRVGLCIYPDSKTHASALHSMTESTATGIWTFESQSNLRGRYYKYIVDVFVPGVGIVRNRVTDPYSIGLNADSQRSYIAALSDAGLTPPGWAQSRSKRAVKRNVDMTIYELHVRDFSMNDDSVRPDWRGKYLAFTEPNSHGVEHLRALSQAGLTDVHLLPIFDIATIPETGCATPTLSAATPDDETPQRISLAHGNTDCYNWGYDPFHFNALEGSYATDANAAPTRIVEFRKMVQALHAMNLRVGMDVVYNHTSASGQHAKSVLDRIVPGYYHRLNGKGEVERSTCCENTATEHMMMAKLMIDSTVLFAREYKIESFRFDLMGHQPRTVMEALQRAVSAAADQPVQLIGEGWNFGEIENNKRFVQASQLSLNGSGIGTFSDRSRDALRGGGYGDGGETMVSHTGWLHGSTDPKRAKWARVGLLGSLRTATIQNEKLEKVDYNGAPAGYVSEPNEVVNYVENHDNHTLFDLNAFRLPLSTSKEDRARVQLLGIAHTALSQGVAYFHAGVDLMRSKSFDQNSYDSGDWFNRIDWTAQRNYFGTGLPPMKDNAGNRAQMLERLQRSALIAPEASQIALVRDGFQDWLRIRASSRLFRLETAQQIESRVTILDTPPTVLAAHIDGENLAEAYFHSIVYGLNSGDKPAQLRVPQASGKPYRLHPVHERNGAADLRPKTQAQFEMTSGTFSIPPKTAMVWVYSP